MYTFTVPSSFEMLPLKDCLRRLHVSLTLRRKLKRSDAAILVNGIPVPWHTIVHPGDIVTLTWSNDCQIAPLSLPLTVIFEDRHLLVVDKPAGLLSHPTTDPTRLSLANVVVGHLRAQNHESGFHPVHRLDRNTSGLLLIAKNPHLQHLFSSNQGINIKRAYLAVVRGIPSPTSGTIDAPIGRNPNSIIERLVRPDGQEAITCYETVRTLGGNSILKLRLLTGRTHQIRVHLAYIGHPILGDDLYGGPTDLIERQALHAAELAFIHPLTGEKVELFSPLPEDIDHLLSALGTNS